MPDEDEHPGLDSYGFPVLSGCGVGCHRQSDDDPRVLLDLKKRCVEAGEKTRAALLEANSLCRDSSDPRYTYNKELKTCLYADRCFYGGADGAAYSFTRDAFSRSVLIQYDNCFRMMGDGSIQAHCQAGGTFPGAIPDLPNLEKKAFISKFRELFGSDAQPPSDLGGP